MAAADRPVRSLVEAGCAGGFFVEAARQAGIAATGIELSAEMVRHARERLGLPVEQGRFESVDPGAPVQAVCACHVLEHVEDPVQFLAAAHAATKPGGRLALEVPNIDAAAFARLGAAWPHIQPAYHRWHFTPGTLGRLVEQQGFRVIGVDTVFSRFSWQPRARLRHARDLLIADWVARGRPSVRHPRLGDVVGWSPAGRTRDRTRPAAGGSPRRRSLRSIVGERVVLMGDQPTAVGLAQSDGQA